MQNFDFTIPALPASSSDMVSHALSQTILVPAATPAPTGTPDGASGSSPNGAPPDPLSNFIIMAVVLGLVLYLMWVMGNRSRKKEEEERNNMLNSIAKGDEVMTIGGIIGKVVEIKDGNFVIQVDKKKDVRIRFGREMIRKKMG